MTHTAMVEGEFWNIVDRSARKAGDPDAHLEALRVSLRELSIDGVISFEITFRRYLNRAYSWDLWGAAYVIHGGCSDDGFEYFRRWLVSRGREAYEAALIDPDSLVQLDLHPTGPDDTWEFEEFYYVALQIFEEKGGEGDIRDYSESEAGLDGSEPSGEPFLDDEVHLAKRYPKLWRRFGDEPLG